MGNGKLYPFERNRFYSGKLLTSYDFEWEQQYFNDKRSFLNRMYYGWGIVNGLQTYAIDDFSIMVESGFALDSMGRELVSPESLVKRLSAIAGFNATKTSQLALCVRYREERTTPVYSVGKNGAQDGFEYNRIAEGCELLLLDDADYLPYLEPQVDYLCRRELLCTEDYRLTLFIPSVISTRAPVRLAVEVVKLTDGEADFSLEGVIRAPGFLTDNGQKEIIVSVPHIRLEKGQRRREEYTLRMENVKNKQATLAVKPEGMTAWIGGKAYHPGEDVVVKLDARDASPQELLFQCVSGVSLEKHFEAVGNGCIKLATITIARATGAYIIEEINAEEGVRRVLTPQSRFYVERFLRWFDLPETPDRESAPLLYQPALPASGGAAVPRKQTIFSTGVVEIPLELHARGGQIYYSDEVMHRLGQGNVYVEIGVEYADSEGVGREKTRHTIYGESRLFSENGKEQPVFTHAVRTDAQRGTFTVAIELQDAADMLILPLRWFAFKLPDADQHTKIDSGGNKSIFVEPSTVTLAPRETYCVQTRFVNLEPAVCRYELTGKNSGEITSDGVYTAPSSEGVYEIKISVIQEPSVYTYLYIVVTRKGVAE